LLGKLVQDTTSTSNLGTNMKEPNYINCEPNWSAMFDYCKAIVRTELGPERGQAAVIEMLDYGKRLHEAQNEGGE